MHPARVRAGRRLLALAVAATIGVLTLTGCRSDPSVAAYIGDTTITEAQVSRVVDEFVDSLPPAQRERLNRASLESQVARIMVLGEVMQRYTAEHRIPVNEPTREQVAANEGVPAGIELTATLARYSGNLEALQRAAKEVRASDEQRREAYRNATIDGQRLAVPYEQARPELSDDVLGKPLGVRELLLEAVEDADVSMNPRYGTVYRLPFQVGPAQSYFSVPLGPVAPVVEAPDPPAAEAPGSGEHQQHG